MDRSFTSGFRKIAEKSVKQWRKEMKHWGTKDIRRAAKADKGGGANKSQQSFAIAARAELEKSAEISPWQKAVRESVDARIESAKQKAVGQHASRGAAVAGTAGVLGTTLGAIHAKAPFKKSLKLSLMVGAPAAAVGGILGALKGRKVKKRLDRPEVREELYTSAEDRAIVQATRRAMSKSAASLNSKRKREAGPAKRLLHAAGAISGGAVAAQAARPLGEKFGLKIIGPHVWNMQGQPGRARAIGEALTLGRTIGRRAAMGAAFLGGAFLTSAALKNLLRMEGSAARQDFSKVSESARERAKRIQDEALNQTFLSRVGQGLGAGFIAGVPMGAASGVGASVGMKNISSKRLALSAALGGLIGGSIFSAGLGALHAGAWLRLQKASPEQRKNMIRAHINEEKMYGGGAGQ